MVDTPSISKYGELNKYKTESESLQPVQTPAPGDKDYTEQFLVLLSPLKVRMSVDIGRPTAHQLPQNSDGPKPKIITCKGPTTIWTNSYISYLIIKHPGFGVSLKTVRRSGIVLGCFFFRWYRISLDSSSVHCPCYLQPFGTGSRHLNGICNIFELAPLIFHGMCGILMLKLFM